MLAGLAKDYLYPVAEAPGQTPDTLGILPEELVRVAGETSVWASRRPDPGLADEGGYNSDEDDAKKTGRE